MGAFTDEPGSTMGGAASGLGGALAGGLVGVGAQLYDSHQDRKTAERNTDKTIAANKAEAELAYQRSVEMWNRQNLYNSPEAQMQRFSQAGLNPHLIYGRGSSGEAQSPPAYQPARQAYNYEAMHLAPGLAGILPTIMAVGTWMQNMRLSEAELNQKTARTENTQTDTEKARQVIEYLRQANPKLLQRMENDLNLYPYQRSIMRYQESMADRKLYDFEQAFRYKYGDDIFNSMGSHYQGRQGELGGKLALERMRDLSNTKLLDAKASWTDYNITDPQAIMQLVMSGLLSQVGINMRAGRRPKITNSVSEQMRGGRIRTRTRVQE